jgi:hypothetical protein
MAPRRERNRSRQHRGNPRQVFLAFHRERVQPCRVRVRQYQGAVKSVTPAGGATW